MALNHSTRLLRCSRAVRLEHTQVSKIEFVMRRDSRGHDLPCRSEPRMRVKGPTMLL